MLKVHAIHFHLSKKHISFSQLKVTEEQMRKSAEMVRNVCQPKFKLADGKLVIGFQLFAQLYTCITQKRAINSLNFCILIHVDTHCNSIHRCSRCYAYR